MIKIANNLVKLAEKVSDETKEKKKGRKVDYKGRALKGALIGALAGGLGGAGIGARRALKLYNPKDHYGKEVDLNDLYPSAVVGGGLGALGGAGIGALAHMFSGHADEDIITRQDEPNRLRRAMLGVAPGALLGVITGGAAGGLRDVIHGETEPGIGTYAGLVGGGLLGGGLGALGGAYLNPWMNADYYGQEGENEGVKSANATSNFSPFTAPFVNRMTPFVNHSNDPYSPAFAPAGSNPMSMNPERMGAFGEKVDAAENTNIGALADRISPQEMAMYVNTAIPTYNQTFDSRKMYMYGPDGPTGYAYPNGLRRPAPSLNDVYNLPHDATDAQNRLAIRDYINKDDYADYLRDLNIDANQRGPLNIGNYYPQSFDAFKKNRK